VIFILTGAGISRESGIATFRGAGGLWGKVRVEDVATPEGFARDPERAHAFYNALRRRLVAGAFAPNAAHQALARLESGAGEPVFLVTQNIDDLHERAGSASVLHMHGELRKARCRNCRGTMLWDEDLSRASRCPLCGAAGSLRPHVVWFGEMPLRLGEIEAALRSCRQFVAIGTSGTVYPAAGFAAAARERGAGALELNLEPSANAAVFDRGIYGRASETVPRWVEETLKNRQSRFPAGGILPPD
jgi:NAD-dependent deacetylase